jgi:hypothetical protein
LKQRAFGAVLPGLVLGLSLATADAETIRIRVADRDLIERRLNDYSGTNAERGARLEQMFVDSGCAEHLTRQAVKYSKAPNVICVLPGSSDRVIIVGAHFDRVRESAGVADNWSGASLLPSLYQSLKVEPRRHTFTFIGFTDEELGLVGSRFYARRMTREQVAATSAMINLDTLGLAPTEVWNHRSSDHLTLALARLAKHMELPLSGVNFERVGSTDSESFAARKIPRITIHSLTQESENEGILHTKKDQLSAMNLDHYYDTYHLVALYLGYLDELLAEPAPAARWPVAAALDAASSLGHDRRMRTPTLRARWAPLITALLLSASATTALGQGSDSSYDALVSLFAEWRAFEKPPPREGVPDYTAQTFARRQAAFAKLQARLAAIEPDAWPIEQRVDYQVVRAEMNGFDFYVRVLQPWVRDPAFYVSIWTAQSDTPAHEGPTNHAAIEVWQYRFPLDAKAERKLASELRTIAPLLAQARGNLTGNARDLWVGGIKPVKQQIADLDALEARAPKAGNEFKRALDGARTATRDFAAWLEAQAPGKTGPSGIGKDNYTWLLQNVYLVPMTWDDEVMLLERELARAHASLKLEELRNQDLPPLLAASTPAEYLQRGNDAVTKLMQFVARKKMLPVKANMDPALRAQIGEFVPEAQRNFFYIASHLEPLALYTHFYHWWDLAQMRDEPHASLIRRGPLLYNIWMNRAEGMATCFEEMTMHAGLYDDNPRGREVQWIMLANRAARGLGALYAQANQFTMKQAADFHVAWTPRGWMSPTLDLLGFEQHLYLRQPGYGSSYVTGKYLIERLWLERSRQLGDDFSSMRMFREFNDAGMIPVSLIQTQLTGKPPAKGP